MKIAIFSDNFYPELGGIQDSILTTGRELGRRGHTIFFYVPRYRPRDYAVAHLPVAEPHLGERIFIRRFGSFPVPSPTQQSNAVLPTPWRWLAVRRDKPDIIHSHTFFGVGIEAIVAAKLLKIPLVGTNHWAFSEFGHYTPFSAKLFERYGLKYVSWYYNKCSFVSAPSNSVLKEMVRYGFRKKHERISNPIDTDTFKPVSLRVKKKLKKALGFSAHTIIFAGRLGSEKKIDVIMRALPAIRKKIPDVMFAIAGHGSARASLHILAKKIGIEKSVTFLGTLSHTSLAEAYQAAELFAIMSTSETQSMVLLQANACGLPAVGAKWRGLAEYISKDNGLHAEPDNEKDFTQKAMLLLSGERRRAILGRKARGFAEQFSASIIAERWENMYENETRNHRRL